MGVMESLAGGEKAQARAWTLLGSIALLLVLGVLGCGSEPAIMPESAEFRIGVYDSRATAVGWANTNETSIPSRCVFA